MKSNGENTANSIGISEVCGNLFSEKPENVILFGFFQEISFSGHFNKKNKDSFPLITINKFEVDKKFIVSKSEGNKIHFFVSIPSGIIPGETYYLIELNLFDKKTNFQITMAGPMPDNLEEKELNFYLKNQIWFYHQLVTDKNKRVLALENSLSWKVTAPLRFILEIFKKIPIIFSKEGVKVTKNILFDKTEKATLNQKLHQILNTDNATALYQHFLNRRAWEELTPKEVDKAIRQLNFNPKISILTPVYNCPKTYLKAAIESVKNQSYTNWELCLYDDCSTEKETIDYLKSIENTDNRIKLKFGKQNLHISDSSNQAYELSSGDFIGLLDHDDTLHPNALFEVVKFLKENPDTDFVYSDEDKITIDGKQTEPYFKPDFNPDLFLSNNYLNHFSVIKREIFEKAGKFRKGYEGSQDYDLFLRIFSLTKNFGHIPKVLYHWRKVPGSTADKYDAKSYPENASLKALSDYLKREKILAEVKKGIFPGSFRIQRTIVEHKKVSIIIPFKDKVTLLKTCLNSLAKTITYNNIEIILVNNRSKKKSTENYLASLDKSFKILSIDSDFNYSALNNNASKIATGEYLLFLNNDIEAIEKGWLTSMVEHIQREEVGAVGAKLSYPDYTIQHAGVILGINGVASHGHKNLPSNSPGYFMRANTIQNLSACTAACLLVKKEVFEKVGGFDEQNLKIAFNDIDFCLKIRDLGYLITYTPFAHLIHYESKSRGFEDTPQKIKRFEKEIDFMKLKWGKKLHQDPYYNKNLTLQKEDFSIKL